MTTDQRLDRIERILILFANAGRRERKRVRELDEKIAILIYVQIKNEDGLRELRQEMQEGFREVNRQILETSRQVHSVGEMVRISEEQIIKLNDAQRRTDQRLDELTDRS